MPKKPDLSVNIDNIEMYENKVFQLSDDYIQIYLNGEKDNVKDHFRHMILYISENLYLDNELLLKSEDMLFRSFNVYTNLCDIYNYVPSYGMFCKLYNIKKSDIKERFNNRYYQIISIINDICQDRIIDYLSNNSGNNRNCQFIASSVYGMSETAPKRAIEDTNKLSNRELLDNIGPVLGIASKQDKID